MTKPVGDEIVTAAKQVKSDVKKGINSILSPKSTTKKKSAIRGSSQKKKTGFKPSIRNVIFKKGLKTGKGQKNIKTIFQK